MMTEITAIGGRVYLIAHCAQDRRGLPTKRNVTQTSVRARTERDALDEFKRAHPDRSVMARGIRGVGE